jgi:hypothetical protein
VFPAVLGPGHQYYIVDHHHLGIALIEQKVKEVWVTKLDDMSWLDPLTFWRTLEFRAWAHLYDHRGRRRPYTDMPEKLTKLQDDPIAVSPAWSGSVAVTPRIRRRFRSSCGPTFSAPGSARD